jgi:putative acyl-CoA dehydrogenase
MGMTEKQGGSDVRTNTTVATPTSEPGVFALRGHKWFTSAPMCDLFLVLAQGPEGLSCFLVPRILPDGSRNPFRIQRLKDKLGNRSNASAEPEFDGTLGWLVGPAGQGLRTILEMVNCTRLDCVAGSAMIMRRTLVEAGHHARHRRVFASLLIDQPLMRNVLADLAVESEAATTLTMRLAGAADRAIRGDAAERVFRRIGVAVGKYWVPKRTPGFTAEALECLGGNGYVEESIMPRLYREAPLNSIWEGSGNINALDVQRILRKQPETLAAWHDEIAPAMLDARIGASVRALERDLDHITSSEARARELSERLAVLWQASLLTQRAPAAISDAFIASRIERAGGCNFGTLPDGTDVRSIVERASPAPALVNT